MQRTNVQLYHDFTYFVGQEFCLTPSRTSKVLYPSCISKTYTRQKSRLNQKLPFFFCVFILDVWMVEVKYKYVVSIVWFLKGRQIFGFRKRTRSLGFPDLCLFLDWLTFRLFKSSKIVVRKLDPTLKWNMINIK